MIEGVKINNLRIIPDERGAVFKMLSTEDSVFQKFGEIYFSMVYPGVVKGWHLHKTMTLNYAVPVGMIKLVLYDNRLDSPSRGEIMELFIGEENYQLVTIPPNIWNGFKGIGIKPALVADCSTHPYSDAEIVRMDPLHNDIPYDWGLKWK